MLITNKGKMVRTKVAGIRETGRNAQGVILINMRDNEILQAVASVVSNDDEEIAEGGDQPSEPA
jgi:DNA gyrase subunit A